MDRETAAARFSELGCTTRLRAVRHLVINREQGLAVGELQRILEVPPSTLSHHLSRLVRAGLIRQERNGRVLQCYLNRRNAFLFLFQVIIQAK